MSNIGTLARCEMCKYLVVTPEQAQLCEETRSSCLCSDCYKSLEEHFALKEEREEEYQRAREERIIQAIEEREQWREERRQQRVQEWLEVRERRDAADYPWGGIFRP